MAQIIQFPNSSRYALVRARAGRRHNVRIRITDRRRPRQARWFSQFAVQRAGGFGCLSGFDDPAALAQTWHTFAVGRTWLLRRFLRDIEQLVADGRVIVEVDSVRVRLKKSIAA